MKQKLVVWAENDKEEKELLAIELQAEDNAITIYAIPENLATEDFYKELMDAWRKGKTVNFPSGHRTIQRPLSVTESLLPEEMKVQRSDVISRAQAEWHFVVLSHKLSQAYRSDLENMGDRIERMKDYDPAIWEELKTFWDKVNTQVREKNLFWDHFRGLKELTNKHFETLKALRNKKNEAFAEVSKANFSGLMTKITEVEKKIEEGKGLHPLFEQMKKIQGEFRDLEMRRGDKNKAWKKIDVVFKLLKEKKYGKSQAPSGSGRMERLVSRSEGLKKAIDRMKSSIGRDKSDAQWEKKRIDNSEGQLESQIRVAKLAMIDERVRSKTIKLDDMLKTQVDLEKRLEREKATETKRQEEKEVAKKVKEEKQAIKSKIAEEMETAKVERKEDFDKLKKAVDKVQSNKKDKKKVATTIDKETKAVAEETKVVIEEARVVAKDSEVVAEENEIVAEESETVAEDSEVVASDSEPVSEENEVVVEEAKVVVKDSEVVAKENEIVAEESETVAEDSEVVASDSEE